MSLLDTTTPIDPSPPRRRFSSLVTVVGLVIETSGSWPDASVDLFRLPVGTVYFIRWLLVPAVLFFAHWHYLSNRFGAFLEERDQQERIIACGVAVFLLLGYVGVVVDRRPTPVRRVPTSESRGIIAEPSPSVILPMPSAGIKLVRRDPKSKREEKPRPPTERPPQGPDNKVDTIESAPEQPEPKQPPPEPEPQTVTAPANETPTPGAPPRPTNVRIVR